MKVVNKKANFNYKLGADRYDAGLELKGAEAKAIRGGKIDLSKSRVKVYGGEAWLVSANIQTDSKDINATRPRKLLLHKKQILALEAKAKQKSLQIIPLSIYNIGRLFKLKLALGKTKRKFEKRDSLKKKDITRQIEKELKTR